MRVLILGSGGREHTLAWKIAQSNQLDELYIAPGNAGTALVGMNIGIDVGEFEKIKMFVIDNKIDMLIIGPEQPLVEGIWDFFKADKQLQDVAIIGMSKQAAQLEGSKDFAKEFMNKYQIPTAAHHTFNESNIDYGYAFLESLKAPYVLKADGLAAGKGVLILDNLEEAKSELHKMIFDNKFGSAGASVVIEEFLDGIELSVFVLTNGKEYVVLPEAKDYKRIGEGDTGLNTGGMGSISPVPFADKAFMKKVEDRIIKPTVKGIAAEGMEYNGFVFIGLMNVDGEPSVIEYNVRLGDPETESVIPRIKNDLLDILKKSSEGKLSEVKMEFDSRFAATVMLVSGGYPEAYEKSKVMHGLAKVEKSLMFHAGTALDENGNVLTNGGRVLALTSFGDTLEESLGYCYTAAETVDYTKKYYRKDLGKDLM
ncbi:MAG: phosphoribosylamine--glycine ligase [Bacteroidetes bacterium]|nr:MAG: phosphoribosylamine--glycine ligase [Bacteroidota bacterium]